MLCRYKNEEKSKESITRSIRVGVYWKSRIRMKTTAMHGVPRSLRYVGKIATIISIPLNNC